MFIVEKSPPLFMRVSGASDRGDELRAVSAWLKERARMKPMTKAFFVSEQRKQFEGYESEARWRGTACVEALSKNIPWSRW